MTQTRLRIPCVAAAALVLGGSACDDSKDGADAESTRGVDASSARVRTVSRSVCESEQRCQPDDFSEEYTSVAECAEWRAGSFPLRGRTGENVRKCQDAVLDLAVCYANASCDAEDDACGEFYATYFDLCAEFGLEDDEEEDELSLSRRPMRGFRIPR